MPVPALTIFVFAPSAAALLAALLPIGPRGTRRLIGFTAGALTLAAFAALMGALGPWTGLTEDLLWIPQIRAHYFLALDGLSGTLLILVFFLAALSQAAGGVARQPERKGQEILTAFMASGMAGVLLARDLLLFFLFWELMVLALFLLVNRYGGEDRQRASLQFLVYTTTGSLLMLVSLAGVYMLNAPTALYPLGLEALTRALRAGPVGTWIALGFLAAFLIKLPMVPLHTWLPDLYRQTPHHTLVGAAFMAKLGGYGLLRFLVDPHAPALSQMALPLATAALVGFLYASAVALAQRRFIDVLIYSSVAHMNLFVIGAVSFVPAGYSGAAFQLLNQGLLLGANFYLASWLGPDHQESSGVGRLDWGRLYLLVGILASLGLPGLSGFPGELLIFVGALQRWPALAVLGFVGVALGAAYFILTYWRLAHGRVDQYPGDLTKLHRTMLALPLAASLALGLVPSLALQFLVAPETSRVLVTAVGSALTLGGAP